MLSRRSQSQYSHRQAGSGQSLNGERRKRRSNAVHPTKLATQSHNLTHVSAAYHQETTNSLLKHSCTQLQPSSNIHSMTNLPEVNCTVNDIGCGTGSGLLFPVPPLYSPPITYYGRPAVARRRRIPAANDKAREREALKRQQRLQVVSF